LVVSLKIFEAEESRALEASGENLVAAEASAAPGESELLDRPLGILLADDSADNRLLVINYLRNTPYEVDEAENGRVAVQKFGLRHYDLVLMDIQMPEMDGCEATRAMRRWERDHRRPRTAIVALTAAALPEDKRRTREAGCDLHVTKPVKRATLLAAIRDAMIAAEAEAEEPAAAARTA
jgi:CheY-like chemotaxis protein